MLTYVRSTIYTLTSCSRCSVGRTEVFREDSPLQSQEPHQRTGSTKERVNSVYGSIQIIAYYCAMQQASLCQCLSCRSSATFATVDCTHYIYTSALWLCQTEHASYYLVLLFSTPGCVLLRRATSNQDTHLPPLPPPFSRRLPHRLLLPLAVDIDTDRGTPPPLRPLALWRGG